MKYLKSFEKIKKKEDIILYKNKDFTISLSYEGNMTYFTNNHSWSPIYGMIDQIKDKSNDLNDPELRNIKITDKEKKFAILSLDPKYESNRVKYHSSVINGFIIGMLSKIDIIKMPDKAYIELDEMYLPIIKDIVKKSETIGDIIDSFKILYDDITEKLPMYINSSKFNL